MKNINEVQEFYVVANEDGSWFGSNTGPYLTERNAQRESDRCTRMWKRKYRVVKMIPIFFDMETNERITPLPEGMNVNEI